MPSKSSSIPKDLSPAEWMVMQVIWDSSDADPELTVSEILPEIEKRRDWHVSTLKTTMDRLVAKGYLASRVRGKTCFYRPLVSREQTTKHSVGSFLDMVLGGAFGPLVAYLAERNKLSQKEIEELERMLEKKGKGRKS